MVNLKSTLSNLKPKQALLGVALLAVVLTGTFALNNAPETTQAAKSSEVEAPSTPEPNAPEESPASTEVTPEPTNTPIESPQPTPAPGITPAPAATPIATPETPIAPRATPSAPQTGNAPIPCGGGSSNVTCYDN